MVEVIELKKEIKQPLKEDISFLFLCLTVLASSLVFSLADGQFSSRADLIDAPGSSLGRGAQVSGLGESTAAVMC